ncbi:hypothetical protein NLU13_9677 [Sarocladium strictum]|uniref:Uncharacterized protein n=1 Tax=Sarocladium strictum TaxID=5046 RepID=A0AA39GAX1_SARSR|nr:hypothetical protein NLU13_9677 [Sarocladium strictum]
MSSSQPSFYRGLQSQSVPTTTLASTQHHQHFSSHSNGDGHSSNTVACVNCRFRTDLASLCGLVSDYPSNVKQNPQRKHGNILQPSYK